MTRLFSVKYDGTRVPYQLCKYREFTEIICQKKLTVSIILLGHVFPTFLRIHITRYTDIYGALTQGVYLPKTDSLTLTLYYLRKCETITRNFASGLEFGHFSTFGSAPTEAKTLLSSTKLFPI